jgi:hypothetical protein
MHMRALMALFAARVAPAMEANKPRPGRAGLLRLWQAFHNSRFCYMQYKEVISALALLCPAVFAPAA